MPEHLADILVRQLGGNIERHTLSGIAPGAAVRLRISIVLPTSGASRTPKFRLVSDKKSRSVTSTFVSFSDTSRAQRAWERASSHIQKNELPIRVSLSRFDRKQVVIHVFDRQVARNWSAAIKRPLHGL